MSDLKTKIRLLRQEEKKQWNEFVRRSQGCFFHTYEWLEFLEKGLSLEPFHLVLEENGNIMAGMPNFAEPVRNLPIKRLSSLPQGDGAFFPGRDRKENLEKILLGIKKICTRAGLASHRLMSSCLDLCKYSNQLERLGYTFKLDGCRCIIDLDKPFPEIKARFSKERIYDIKKVQADSRLQIMDLDVNEENLKIFYKIYLETMGRIGGDPIPESFFKQIPGHVKEHTKLFMARVEDRYIAGFIHFLDPFQKRINHYFGVSLNHSVPYKPNILLHLHSIQWGIESGYHSYDMGGSGFFEDSIFKFKEQWGGDLVPNLIWEKNFPSVLGFVYKIGKKIHGR